jgi:hypothetical protein
MGRWSLGLPESLVPYWKPCFIGLPPREWLNVEPKQCKLQPHLDVLPVRLLNHPKSGTISIFWWVAPKPIVDLMGYSDVRSVDSFVLTDRQCYQPSSPHMKALLEANSVKWSGSWLHALPLPYSVLTTTAFEYRTA